MPGLPSFSVKVSSMVRQHPKRDPFSLLWSLGPACVLSMRKWGAKCWRGGGGGGQSMTWEELCDDDVNVWFAHASHSWFMKLLGSPCDQTAYVMKRCSLGCIHLDSDSQLLRGPWGGVGEGRVSRHHVFLVSGVACQNASSCFIYLTWKSLHHFTLVVVLSPVATVKS